LEVAEEKSYESVYDHKRRSIVILDDLKKWCGKE
jgi:hypothetical protein